MNEDRIHQLAGRVERAQAAGVDLCQRTPADMALQLQRDATSLELTGSHLEKDKAFYEAVAADLREAAGYLANWQTMVDHLQRRAAAEKLDASIATMSGAVASAEAIRDAVPNAAEGCTWWRLAGDAVASSLRARLSALTAKRQWPIPVNPDAGVEVRK